MLASGVPSEFEIIKKLSIKDYLTKFCNFVDKIEHENKSKK